MPSRYRAARSFMHGRGDLDWWVDDPSIAPSAGALLLGRRVIAPNQQDAGRLYLATVMSQIDRVNFVVDFNPPTFGAQKIGEFIQELHVYQMLSYTDLHRHAILAGDHIIVPQSALEYDSVSEPTENGRVEVSEPFLEPFHLATVLTGHEPRCISKGLKTVDVTLIVQLAHQTEGVTHRVKPNTALWIPFPWLQRQSDLTRSNVLPLTKTNTEAAGQLPVGPFNQLPPFAKGGLHCEPIPAFYTRQQVEQMAQGHRVGALNPSKSDVDTTERYTGNSDVVNNNDTLRVLDETTQTKLSQRWLEEPVARTDEEEARRISRRFQDVETSVDKDLDYGSMSVRWIRGSRGRSRTRDKPQWRYWGAKSIPGMIDPPVHEPYKDVGVWGRTDRVHDSVELIRPEIHFTKVRSPSGALTHPLDYRDSTQIHLALRDPPNTQQNRSVQTVQTVQNGMQPRMEQFNEKPSCCSRLPPVYTKMSQPVTKWQQVDSVAPSMHDYHRERALAQLMRQSNREGDVRLVRTLRPRPSSQPPPQ